MKSSEKTKLVLMLATLIPTFSMQTSISAADLGSKTGVKENVLKRPSKL